MARRDPDFGLLLPFAHTRAADGGGTRNTVATEAAPEPGEWVPAADDLGWSAVATVAQDTAIDVACIRGGYPDRDGLQVVLIDSADVVHGWCEPTLIRRHTVPTSYQDDVWNRFAACARSDTGEIVIVAQDDNTGTAGRAWSYNPRSGAWSDGYDFGPNQGLRAPVMLAEDPTTPGRVLLWSGWSATPRSVDTIAYYSDDSGATWVRYSTGLYDTGQAGGAELPAVGVHPVDDWVAFVESSSAGSLSQYASSDRGVSWSLVSGTVSAHLTNNTISVARSSRGYVVGYRTDTDSFPAVRVLTSARQAFEDADEVLLSLFGTDFACLEVALSVDADGAVYAVVVLNNTTGNATVGQIVVYRSDNGGYTWQPYRRAMLGDDLADGVALQVPVAVWSCGQLHLVGGDAENHLCMLIAGGYDDLVHGGIAADTQLSREYRFGYVRADTPSGGAIGTAYVPIGTATASGYTVTSSGTTTEDLALGGLHLVATSAVGTPATITVRKLLATTATSGVDYAAGAARVQVLDGDVLAAARTVIRAGLANSLANGVRVVIRFGTDGIRVEDAGGAVRATDTTTIPTTATDVRWFIRWDPTASEGRATVWVRQDGDASWTRIADEVLLINSAGVDTDVAFEVDNQNVILATIGDRSAVLSLLAHGIGLDWRHDLEGVAALDLTPADGVRGMLLGRPLPPSSSPYPLPLLTSDTTRDLGRMHGIGGPAYIGQQGTLAVGHVYPLDALEPSSEPRPRVSWRATGTSEVSIVYDATTPVWRGGALALVALRASLQTVELSVDDGASGWTVLGTLDKGASMSYTRASEQIRPSGATTINRYHAEGELVGGYVILPTSGASVARRITANSAGFWSASAGQPMRIQLTGLVGGELSSGTATLVYPSGVLVVYPAVDTARRYLRIRIPSGQIVPADRGESDATSAYDAGILAACRVVGLGTAPRWSPSCSVVYPRSVTRSADGTPSQRRLGDPRQVWSYDLSPSVARLMRSLSTAPDHIAASGSQAIGTYQDGWRSLPAALETLDGAPCVVVPVLPTAASTLTDPTTYLYGLQIGDLSLTYEPTGQEGTDEVVAVGALTVEGLT